jgi:magnesium chelatase subunit D
VAALLALDPISLGGVHVRAPNGPERGLWLKLLKRLAQSQMPIKTCPLSIDQERLFGGLDLTASLAAGRQVHQSGLLAECAGGLLALNMAECLSDNLGAQIAHCCDNTQGQNDGFGLILFDEGADEAACPPVALSERCAFMLDLDSLAELNACNDLPSPAVLASARACLNDTPQAIDLSHIETLVRIGAAFGVSGIRPIVFAHRIARLVAALSNRHHISPEDLTRAARLAFAHRATQMPEAEGEPDAAPESQSEPSSQTETDHSPPPEQQADSQTDSVPNPPSQASDDMLVEMVKASLPAQLIARILAQAGLASRARARDGRGSGDGIVSAKRGRPLGSRRGSLRSGQRLHLIDTLRAAAPWQKLRRASAPQNTPSVSFGDSAPVGRGSTEAPKPKLIIARDDIRLRRFIEKRETTLVFVVDASGSSAWQRLNEAKGAVQLMLAKAYQTRARVALIAFRNKAGELILPPTRSLTRARRLLSDMIGGGGTPLAAGLEEALKLAQSEKGKGRTARILLLSDGQANVARDGTPGRPQAQVDTAAIARQVRHSGIATIHLDTSARLRADARQLATQMGATYAPLPSANARAMTRILEGTN